MCLSIGGSDVEISLSALFRAVWISGIELFESATNLAGDSLLTVCLEQVKHQLTSIPISILNSCIVRYEKVGGQWSGKLSRLTFLYSQHAAKVGSQVRLGYCAAEIHVEDGDYPPLVFI